MEMNRMLIEQIKAALNTQEDGENLINIARNAHAAEQKLSRFYCLRAAGKSFEEAASQL